MSRFLFWLLTVGSFSASLPGLAQAPTTTPPSTPIAPPAAPTASAATAVALAAALPPLAALNAQQIDNLTALGQVWGFLKYFHPAVAAGQRDWDAEFLRQLPAVLACRAAAERSALLGSWVAALGPVPACPACTTPPTRPVHLSPDLRWAADARRFSGPLRQQLAFIAANRYQGIPYYVAQKGSTTLFPHEEAYPEPALPAQGLRLLGLCRYWNMLQYYYPYPYVLDQEWARVLPQLLPRFAEAGTALAYRHAALTLFAQVHDGHARFYPPDPLLEAERGDFQVAAEVQFIDNQAVVVHVRHDGLAPVPPLEPGDVLTHFAGTSVAKLVQQRLPETGASNRPAQLNTIAQNLLFCATPQVEVRVQRAGQALRLLAPATKVGAAPAEQPAVADSMYRLLTPEVGYIDIARIKGAKVVAIMQAFAHTKGIVIDQRNYPGEVVATYLPRFFLTRPTAFAKFTQRDPSSPGRFLWQVPDSLRPLGSTPYAGQVVVLVNEKSRSQAEFMAMAFQASPHGRLLGSQTAGADGNTTPITLPGGLKTLMTGIGAYYPDGRETQRVGVAIDVPVRPTIAGLRQGHDELRDQAVELILHPARPAR